MFNAGGWRMSVGGKIQKKMRPEGRIDDGYEAFRP
jgi:hypothetical protein